VQVRKNSDTIGLPIIEEAIVRIVQGLSEPPLPDRRGAVSSVSSRPSQSLGIAKRAPRCVCLAW